MNIEQMFQGDEQKQIRGHFENMIDLAKSDGHLAEKEIEYLRHVAGIFNIAEEVFQYMLEHDNQYEFNPPTSKDERYLRFYRLIRTLISDDVVKPIELKTLKRFAAGLDIPDQSVNELTQFTLTQVHEGKGEDEIIESYDSIIKKGK